MTRFNDILHQPVWRFVDESLIARTKNPIESFAMDDTLCHLVGEKRSAPTIRTWVHERAVILGIQDRRMPHFQEALQFIESKEYAPIVRNSGGLAVALDEGVLNISLIFSEEEGAIQIQEGFEAMLSFVRLLFPERARDIVAREIVGSYCPGDYDLSIDGKKFAGISQRRLRRGVAVQVYLAIEGSGAKRAAFIRDMYAQGIQGQQTKVDYPDIQPDVMATLSELIEPNLTVQDVVFRTQQLAQTLSEQPVQFELIEEDEMPLYIQYLQRMIKRNQR